MESIKLLTFNVWGLKYISKHRKERMEGICQRLLDPAEDYDVIAFQEVWCQEDWDMIKDKLSELYHFSRYFSSGIIAGPGLGILSKIPIKETWLYRFPINGKPSAIHRGDWYVGKSLAVTVLANDVVILNSHMHAPYSASGDDAYIFHRACQAWDISRVIKTLDQAGYRIVLVGDLNSKPGSLPHKMFTHCLRDSWELLKMQEGHLLTTEELAKLPPREQITLGGVTCNSQMNTWRKHSDLKDACRLDYALINDSLDVLEAQVKFIDTVPNLACSYSDHFAYYVNLNLKDKIKNIEKDNAQMIDICKEFLAEIQSYEIHDLPRNYIWKQYVFYACIGGLLMLSIFGVLINKVLLIVLLPLLSIIAVVSGMISILWVMKEKRAITEIKLEVTDVLNGIYSS